MAEPLPVTERELRFLRELVRCQVAFLIVGPSAAALQGAPVVTQDVDLWFRNLDDPNLVEALRRVGGAYVAPTALTPPMLAGEGLELFDVVLRMDGLRSFDEECAAAVELDVGDVVAKVLPLPRILASKRAAARRRARPSKALASAPPASRGSWRSSTPSCRRPCAGAPLQSSSAATTISW